MKKSVKLFDTTLRDGSQSENVSFSVEDKLLIARKLDEFGVHYIEGGWPGSNPKDLQFFKQVRQKDFKHARLVAFGSTSHKNFKVEEDPRLNVLLEAETPTVCIVGKSWLLHVEFALEITPEENLERIADTVAFMKSRSKEVVYDAEHFFDGYEDHPEYALKTLSAAQRGGADVLVLCDTNGGTLPQRIAEITAWIKSLISIPLGIHAHNDSGLAVANTLMAVESGAEHVHGTINGYGERCGNADLCTIIPNLQLKMGYPCVTTDNLARITYLSNYISEVANLSPRDNAPFVGKSAFAHKGGVHVSAVMKEFKTYEHLSPELIGNRRRVLVSDLSGKSNVIYKASELGVDLGEHEEKIPRIVDKLKEMENMGYQFEAAEGSLELLMRQVAGDWKGYFELGGFRILVEKDKNGIPRSEATVRLEVKGTTEHIAAEGDGPVHALDSALRKALHSFYPEIEEVELSDYKVRVLNQKDGTAAMVRVLIDFHAGDYKWGTVGVSENIIEASWQALTDGYSYFLLKQRPY
ncbi:MAG: citramalate synthase [Proteobacteria bacterium]|nr:citramalate synthase [Pseudomonadota bacterium]